MYFVQGEMRLEVLKQYHNALEHVLSRLKESEILNEGMFRLKDCNN